jgi:hypothetical protein
MSKRPPTVPRYFADPPRGPKPITITVPVACAISGIGPTKMWALIKTRQVEIARAGGRTLILLESLERLLTPEHLRKRGRSAQTG